MRLTIVRRAAKVIAWVIYTVVLVVMGLGIAYDFGRPARSACESRLPWFEGLVVERAERHLRPPMLRCVAVDTDEPQRGERAQITGWHTGDVAAVLLILGPSVFVGGRRLGRLRDNDQARQSASV